MQLRAGLFHFLARPSDEARLGVEFVLGDREGLFSLRELLGPAVQGHSEGLHFGVPLLHRALLRLESRFLLDELFPRGLRIFRGDLRFAEGLHLFTGLRDLAFELLHGLRRFSFERRVRGFELFHLRLESFNLGILPGDLGSLGL